MTHIDTIAGFIRDQYVADRGDVRENVEALFSADLAYHVDGEVLIREDLVRMGTEVRAIPAHARRIVASEFESDGNVVRWRLVADLPGAGADDVVHQDSHVTALFGPDDTIHTVWAKPTGETGSLPPPGTEDEDPSAQPCRECGS